MGFEDLPTTDGKPRIEIDGTTAKRMSIATEVANFRDAQPNQREWKDMHSDCKKKHTELTDAAPNKGLDAESIFTQPIQITMDEADAEGEYCNIAIKLEGV